MLIFNVPPRREPTELTPRVAETEEFGKGDEVRWMIPRHIVTYSGAAGLDGVSAFTARSLKKAQAMAGFAFDGAAVIRAST